MILDKLNQLSDSQALTATAASTNVIDFGEDRDIGVGEPMAVVFNVEVAADTTDTDETYAFALETDTVENFASPTVLQSSTIAGATLAQGYKFALFVPKSDAVERYFRVNYTLGGTTPSVTVSAHLVPASFVEQLKDYASGFTIS